MISLSWNYKATISIQRRRSHNIFVIIIMRNENTDCLLFYSLIYLFIVELNSINTTPGFALSSEHKQQ